MKKILLGFVLFSLFMVSGHVYATDTTDTTHRIMYWWGKVNQHVDAQGVWQSDPDGTSGANIDKLAYCKKWYPNTTSVVSYQSETINTWRRAIGYEQSGYTATVVSDKCIDSIVPPPSKLSVDLKVNNSDNPLPVLFKSKITPSWNSTGASSCMAAGHWVPVWPGNSGLWNNSVSTTSGSLDLMAAWANNGDLNQIQYLSQLTLKVQCWDANSNQVMDEVTVNVYQENPTLDITPRVAMWYGKVNQHVDTQGNWVTDPDGVSGAGSYAQWGSEGYGDRKLLYCQKFYPKTTSVEDYKNETINSWREKYNTGGPYTLAVMTTKCVQGLIDNTVPSVTVILPNGGESYTPGQQITIRWKTNNIKYNPDTLVAVMDDRIPDWQTLSLFGSSPALNYAKLISSNGNENIYEYSFTAPKTFNDSLPKQYQNIYGGNHYKILANVLIGGQGGTPTQQIVEDYSDNNFSINSTGITFGQKNNEIMETPFNPSLGGNNYIPRKLKLGMYGEDVKLAQKIVGAKVDGKYGKGTIKKVKEWQKKVGSTPNGLFDFAILQNNNVKN